MSPSPRQIRSATHGNFLQACVRSIGHKEHRGTVVATHQEIATIEFPRASGPYFPVAQEITVAFRSPEIFQPFAARSRVLQREDNGDHVRYKLRFSEEDAQTLSALVKRRTSPRVVPDGAVAISICDAESADDDTFLEARLRDLSATGCSFYVDPPSEMRLCSARQLRIRFRLPGDAEKFGLVGEVRYRRLVDHSIQYGVRFDWKAEPRVLRARDRLEDFVGQRKRAIMERAMGPGWDSVRR
jgi:hypothetical protein